MPQFRRRIFLTERNGQAVSDGLLRKSMKETGENYAENCEIS
ncbi:hypothetical protein CLOBOL_06855 [Enterocloster bolteae ATCC BAA-613]|uniref:Uncharacterized protein n=1 Tax=Enterocloster bolteae (strain ATCC BAA-613 / DSM 15670 / CCUG 46953 / JCM 12243 / WAL 16351) TaxID=411902 RepID=A8S490_ENTBW|nr:hypothetical protein CLOBOL_06855 [Enterocloster bolteae ATCC BAA-613]